MPGWFDRWGPSGRELKQWASLARLLCEQGWAPGNALATAWRHTYVSCQPSPDARACAAAAFHRHCILTAADVPAANPLALSLHRPAAWPRAVSTADIASGSQLATLEVDAALLAHLLAQVAAAEAAGSGDNVAVVSGAFGAAALPAPLLATYLRGVAVSGSGTSLLQSMGGAHSVEAGVERGLRLLQFAAVCFAERASAPDWRHRLQWISSLSEQVGVFCWKQSVLLFLIHPKRCSSVKCKVECVLYRPLVWQARARAPERQLIRPQMLLQMLWGMPHSQSFYSCGRQHRQDLACVCLTMVPSSAKAFHLTQELCLRW